MVTTINPDDPHTSTFYVPVVLHPGTTRCKALVIRQPADDPTSATVIVRRRFAQARVYTPRTAMPDAAYLKTLVAECRQGAARPVDRRRALRKREMQQADRELREMYRA